MRKRRRIGDVNGKKEKEKKKNQKMCKILLLKNRTIPIQPDPFVSKHVVCFLLIPVRPLIGQRTMPQILQSDTW